MWILAPGSSWQSSRSHRLELYAMLGCYIVGSKIWRHQKLIARDLHVSSSFLLVRISGAAEKYGYSVQTHSKRREKFKKPGIHQINFTVFQFVIKARLITAAIWKPNVCAAQIANECFTSSLHLNKLPKRDALVFEESRRVPVMLSVGPSVCAVSHRGGKQYFPLHSIWLHSRAPAKRFWAHILLGIDLVVWKKKSQESVEVMEKNLSSGKKKKKNYSRT